MTLSAVFTNRTAKLPTPASRGSDLKSDSAFRNFAQVMSRRGSLAEWAGGRAQHQGQTSEQASGVSTAVVRFIDGNLFGHAVDFSTSRSASRDQAKSEAGAEAAAELLAGQNEPEFAKAGHTLAVPKKVAREQGAARGPLAPLEGMATLPLRGSAQAFEANPQVPDRKALSVKIAAEKPDFVGVGGSAANLTPDVAPLFLKARSLTLSQPRSILPETTIAAKTRAEFASLLGPVNITMRADSGSVQIVARVSGLVDEQRFHLLKKMPALTAEMGRKLGEIRLNGLPPPPLLRGM